ncbi:MAG TPA: crosslink repair DNA glycosylase YcaQ family protein [Solirubrobacteraceae bacterium]|nr:crosslink repair DNA glycosylase YcaQ family protein [Solirubrobacteraceae bacterium]
MRRLSASAARRIALAAQGFAEPRPRGRIDARHVRRVIDRIGLLQLDSVSAVCRSHYLPLYSRLGPYPRELLDRLAAHGGSGPSSAERRELFEYWGHEASLLPVALHPLLRWRMARADVEAWDSVRKAGEHEELLAEVLALVRERGPLRSSETGHTRTSIQRGMWGRHDGKAALEYLFYRGSVSTAHRRNFERIYDLTERILPAAVLALPTPAPEEAQRELVKIAARAMGVASEPDLGDYFRLPRLASRERVAELAAAGELEQVEVEGWREPGYLWPGAKRPRRIAARALLSPFDSLIWRRERTERLFSFRYRLEIYTPAPKRVYGYYVLPFLLGEELVARVDLKADAKTGTLRVLGAFAEPGADPATVVPELAAELETIAGWLGLARVEPGRRGDLAGPLRRQVAG